MAADAAPFTAIVLAAQREGQIDPLAERAGVSHKCLVPILGRPLIDYVLESLAKVPGVARIRICVEPPAVDAVRGIAEARGVDVDFVASQPTITESVYASAEGVEGPILITTADNVNMTPEAVRQVMAPIFSGDDCTIALASREAVLAARSETQPNAAANARIGPYRFADGRYSNCNLYGLSGRRVLSMAEAFRQGGQFSKNRKRLLAFVGPVNIALYALKLMTLERAMKRLSKRFGVKVTAVALEDGTQAVDVDNFRTYDAAEAILKAKAARAA